MGILVGLNVIDCNLCVKEEDLDSQQGVIDFSLYLRSTSRNIDPNDNNNHVNQQQYQQHPTHHPDESSESNEINADGSDNYSTNSSSAFDTQQGQGNMIAVLDQKNYIEELNRHLKYAFIWILTRQIQIMLQ